MTLSQKYGFENPFKPDPFAKQALKYFKGGRRLLDIGCGEGADSVFFAGKGFAVTAIDKNKIYLKRFRAYKKDHQLANISIRFGDAVQYYYKQNYYDVINCLLVICCMRKSDVEKILPDVKQSVKPGGIIIMSARNYLDPEFKEYLTTEKMIEPNTFRKKDDCCKITYFIEKEFLLKSFEDFEILYYFEGLVPDKYRLVEKHGDSYIVCRRKFVNNIR